MHIVTKASYFNQLKILNFYTKFERFKGKNVLFYKSAQSFFMYPINIVRMTVPYCTGHIHIPLYVPFQWAGMVPDGGCPLGRGLVSQGQTGGVRHRDVRPIGMAPEILHRYSTST
jgi:hypothetical protein